ncbi:MAG: SirB2 family protein [Spongiibacteraceae bacterium]
MELLTYPTIKLIHISTAVISIGLFTYRGSQKLRNHHYQANKWLRTLPHINDSILLACAIYLATLSHQYPISHPWLSAKIIGLLLYIGFGMMVMRFARNQLQRSAAFVLALLSFAYIVAVAISRDPFVCL